MKTLNTNMKSMKNAKGFTLIELMIVVAIIGILAAVALPAYNDYTKKARFAEVVTNVGAARTAVEICFQTEGTLSNCDAGAQGIPAAVVAGTNDTLDTLTIVDGVITATSTASTDSANMIATPTAGSPLTWAISSTTTPDCTVNGWC